MQPGCAYPLFFALSLCVEQELERQASGCMPFALLVCRRRFTWLLRRHENPLLMCTTYQCPGSQAGEAEQFGNLPVGCSFCGNSIMMR